MEAPLNIADLSPKETSFVLTTRPNEAFTICRWSLRIRAWAITKYTPLELKKIFEETRIDEIADIIWFMLKDNDKLKFNNSKDEFLDSVSSIQDQVNIIMAVLGAVGIGEPEMKKIADKLEKKKVTTPEPTTPPELPKAKKKKIGAKSTTP